MKFKLGDILIVALIVITAFFMIPKKSKGCTAVLEISGDTIKIFNLSKDTEYTFENEYKSTIVVKDGKISVKSSNCPDNTCVHSGTISHNGELICCLPNQMLIRIEGDPLEMDVITG